MPAYAANIGMGFNPDPIEPVMLSLFQQYERVLIGCLVTSFGLDFIVKDQYGGDVDTVYNVLKIIESDSEMKYKNPDNATDYANRGDYAKKDYDNSPNYVNLKGNARKAYNESHQTIKDAYTGKDLHFLGHSKGAQPRINAEVDHVIATKAIHDDRGRVLAGIRGKDLADARDNLRFTNKSLNASMQDVDIPVYIEKHPELPDDDKQRMLTNYNKAKSSYDAKVATDYYTSSKFAKDLSTAATKVGLRMGVRQALGFLFAEIWFAVKEEFQKIESQETFDLGEFFIALGNGLKRGFENAKEKYEVLFSHFFDGVIAGALSSLTTTLCNIFFTTAKNVVNIIRQSYASLVEAIKIMFINPENHELGDRMCAVVKTIATGSSVILGVIVHDAVAKLPISTLPVICDVVPEFCGAFSSLILSCTMLYFIDRSETINKLVGMLNTLNTIETEVHYYCEQAIYFEKCAAELASIDYDAFHSEIALFKNISGNIEEIQDPIELNKMLRNALQALEITAPWGKDRSFDAFISDKNAYLVFE